MVSNLSRVWYKSVNEYRLLNFLNENNIVYQYQKKFDGCKHKTSLPFDFFILDKNMCIEYDGIQHYEPVKLFGGIKNYEYRKKLDEIKNEYCKNNNIHLIRISYKEDIITKLELYFPMFRDCFSSRNINQFFCEKNTSFVFVVISIN